MMDNILHIVPYTAEHGRFILSCQMNHALMDKDARFEGDAMNLVQDHLSFTGLVGKKPIFAAGMKMIWGQVAEGWVIATQDVWDHPLLVARAIKKDFARVAKQYNIKILSDEIYTDLTFDKSYESISKFCPENTFISGGLSKWCGAGGWRLGFFAVPNGQKDFLNALKTLASESYSCLLYTSPSPRD